MSYLEAPDKNAAEKKYEYITYDSSLSDKPIEDDIVFYFTVSDPNLASSEKQMTMEFSYYNGSTNVVLGADHDPDYRCDNEYSRIRCLYGRSYL